MAERIDKERREVLYSLGSFVALAVLGCSGSNGSPTSPSTTTPGAGSTNAACDQIFAQSPYSARGRRDTTNTTDGIYQSGDAQLLVPLTASGGGYGGTFNISVRV